jgi:hypothetical protein
MLNCYQIIIGALAKKTALLQTLICGLARGVCKCAVLCEGVSFFVRGEKN